MKGTKGSQTKGTRGSRTREIRTRGIRGSTLTIHFLGPALLVLAPRNVETVEQFATSMSLCHRVP